MNEIVVYEDKQTETGGGEIFYSTELQLYLMGIELFLKQLQNKQIVAIISLLNKTSFILREIHNLNFSHLSHTFFISHPHYQP
jgi:hypothetical protein